MRKLKDSLSELDQRYDEALPTPEMKRALRQRLGLDGVPSPRRRTSWFSWTRLGLALAFSAVLVVFVERGVRPSPTPPRALVGFRLSAASPDLQSTLRGDTLEVTHGSVTADGPSGIHLQVRRPSRIRREKDGVRVLAGEVLAEVEHVGPAQVRNVFVSGGTIEVHGTQFTVVQGVDRGSVTLHTGSIVFRALDGRARDLRPGNTLRWPLEPEPVAPTPSEPPPPEAQNPGGRGTLVDAQRVLEQVATLRARRDFSGAAHALRTALSQPLKPASRELLSYELGSILTYHLHRVAQACAHWDEHLRQFSRGARAADARAARSTLPCR